MPKCGADATTACDRDNEGCGFCSDHCVFANCPVHGEKDDGMDINDKYPIDGEPNRYKFRGTWMTWEEANKAEDAYKELISSTNRNSQPKGCLLMSNLYLLNGKFERCKEEVNPEEGFG